jgi:hypothetical protein
MLPGRRLCRLSALCVHANKWRTGGRSLPPKPFTARTGAPFSAPTSPPTAINSPMITADEKYDIC